MVVERLPSIRKCLEPSLYPVQSLIAESLSRAVSEYRLAYDNFGSLPRYPPRDQYKLVLGSTNLEPAEAGLGEQKSFHNARPHRAYKHVKSRVLLCAGSQGFGSILQHLLESHEFCFVGSRCEGCFCNFRPLCRSAKDGEKCAQTRRRHVPGNEVAITSSTG